MISPHLYNGVTSLSEIPCRVRQFLPWDEAIRPDQFQLISVEPYPNGRWAGNTEGSLRDPVTTEAKAEAKDAVRKYPDS